jgi:hypothetical protein
MNFIENPSKMLRVQDKVTEIVEEGEEGLSTKMSVLNVFINPLLKVYCCPNVNNIVTTV